MSASDTRERILATAREAFADAGFEATSVRSIASRAGVDQALVHRYFGTKKRLFLATLDVPFDPGEVLAPVRGADPQERGEVLVRTLLELWDSEAEPVVLSVVRTLMTTADGADLVRGFLEELTLVHLRDLVDSPVGSAPLRVSLVASQMAGLLMARKVARLEPVASLPVADTVALVAPVVQHYLTGDLRASRP